uniref:hypothetical protein n=1 Tax=Scandinavium goeteborgense TaxID=1851514 RepID=UPI00135BC1DD|nr:hypothetical protein [Scandinavium goeteborgense]
MNKNSLKCILLAISLFPVISDASPPKGGAFKFANNSQNTNIQNPMDMPLAMPISNFFGRKADGDWEIPEGANIAVNVMYVVSEGYDGPDYADYYESDYTLKGYTPRNPAEDDLGEDNDDSKVMSVNDAKTNPYVYGHAATQAENNLAITTCHESVTAREYTINCDYWANDSDFTRYKQLYQKYGNRLRVDTILFPAIGRSPTQGRKFDVTADSAYGDRQEKIIYFPHRYLDLIHVEALILRSGAEAVNDEMDRRIVTFTYSRDVSNPKNTVFSLFRQDDARNPVYPYYSPSLSWGAINSKDPYIYTIPSKTFLPEEFDIRDVEAIHTRLSGLRRTTNWACLSEDDSGAGTPAASYCYGEDDSDHHELYRSNAYVCFYDHDARKLPSGATPERLKICGADGNKVTSTVPNVYDPDGER